MIVCEMFSAVSSEKRGIMILNVLITLLKLFEVNLKLYFKKQLVSCIVLPEMLRIRYLDEKSEHSNFVK